jgi:hypothetical protein
MNASTVSTLDRRLPECSKWHAFGERFARIFPSLGWFVDRPRERTMDFSEVPCPHCGHVQAKSLQPGQRWKCRACRTRFRVPTLRQAARRELVEALAACDAAERSVEGASDIEEHRVAAVVTALLAGLPRKQVLQVLAEHGFKVFEARDLVERAVPYVRRGARRAGIKSVAYGASMLVGGVIVAYITFTANIPVLLLIVASLVGTGLVFLLVGILKVFTGWNLH